MKVDGRLGGRCRVLHVAWKGDVGGITLQLAEIVRRTPGHAVCFLNGEGAVADALVREGLAVRLWIDRAWAPSSLWRLVRALRAIRPEVVHLHAPDSLTGVAATLVALPGARRVYTEHASRVLRWRNRKIRAVYRLLRRSQHRFVALAPSMVGALQERGVDPDRISCIPNLVAVPRREVTDTGRPAHTVGVVGRLVPVKRIDLLIDVIAELRGRGIQCSGVVVGEGSERPALEARASAAGVGPWIEFRGERRDVLGELDRLDVFFATSEVDVYPVAPLEAMARGVPVVAMACEGGLADIARMGGRLLPDRDVAAAADAIAGLLASRDARAELRVRGYRLVAEHEPAVVLAQLERLYRSLPGYASRGGKMGEDIGEIGKATPPGGPGGHPARASSTRAGAQ